METKKSKLKVIYIGNFAQHYRKAIFQLMDQTFDCDFLFGKKSPGIKTMDLSTLRGNVTLTDTKLFPGGYWQKGVVGKLFQHYDRYVILGEIRSLSTWAFCLLARLMRKDVAMWSHGWYGRETRRKRWMKKIFLRLPNRGVLLYGNHARELMLKEGFDGRKLRVIHNSLDYSRQLGLRRQMRPGTVYTERFGNSNPCLVFVGRLTAVKRLDMALDAMAACRQRGHEYNMTIVGDGEQEASLREQAARLGLERNVWFHGACYDEGRNAELLYNADLCVSPGNVGLTAIHALSFGCPVLTHNDFPYQMPEFEAIRPGLTGDFFTRGDVSSLAGGIEQWLASHADRESVRQACYKEIDESWTPAFQMGVLLESLK